MSPILHKIRIPYILVVVFFSLYFLLLPVDNNGKEHDKTLKDSRYFIKSNYKINPDKELLLKNKYQKLTNDGIALARKFMETDLEKMILESRGNLIFGTKVNTTEKVLAFRKKLECVIDDGHWGIDLTPRPIIKHKQEPLFGKCDRKNRYLQQVQYTPLDTNDAEFIKEYFENSRDSVKYVWKNKNNDEKCTLPRFTRKEACKILSGRRVALFGDSTNFIFHDLLLDYFHDGPVQCYGEFFCKEHFLCRSEDGVNVEKPEFKTSSMKFFRNDHLNINKVLFESVQQVDLKDVSIPWTYFITYFNTVILNTGHHHQDDEKFIKSLIKIINFIRKMKPNSLIIYKASTTGHLDCGNGAVQQRPLKEERSYSEIDDLPYNWNMIHKQNMIAKEIIEAAGGVYMNVEKLMETRIDGHIGGQDCLRWCIPGPADVWLDLLFFIFDELHKAV